MKKLFIVILLLLSAATRSAAQRTPLEFSDKMVDIVAELYDIGQQWGKAVNSALESDDWSGLKPVREQMQAKVTQHIAELQVMKDVKNSTAFRMAVIEFLKYEQKLVTDCFMPFEKFDANTSADAMTAARDKLVAASEAEEKALQKLRLEQSTYASDNGFEIEKQ